MVFSSLSFIFIFIPLTAFLYFIVQSRVWRNAVLLAASLIFYSWGEPKLVLLMMLTAFTAWIGGLLIERLRKRRGLFIFVFVVTVSLITLNLLVFKYLGFFAENVNALLGLSLNVPVIRLPIGISFYTFQILSYVIDLYRGKVALQKNYLLLLLYVCFFPQLIAGPIVRYSTVELEITKRNENLDEISCGIRRFIIGLSKKVIISNGVAGFAETVYAGDPAVYGSLMYWLAAVAYSLQIYFDFSGYSDMAIGLGRIFGFHFLENFDHPYISTSVTEFWRRWHMSLSSWFRDYIYIPLGGNRAGAARHLFNIMTVWALTGFWHGAAWNFILWGIYYGVLLCIEKFVFREGSIPAAERKENPVITLLRWLVTMFIVVLGWTLFNAPDFAALALRLKMMFGLYGFSYMNVLAANTGIIEGALYIPLGLVFMFPVGSGIRKLFGKYLDESAAGILIQNLWHTALLLLCTVYLVSSSFNPFIYFRF